jgi:hypothetical protein
MKNYQKNHPGWVSIKGWQFECACQLCLRDREKFQQRKKREQRKREAQFA